jgi:hypothetical protein
LSRCIFLPLRALANDEWHTALARSAPEIVTVSECKVQAPASLVYRGSVPYFRLRIPQQLQATFGAREIKQSLGRIGHEAARGEARRTTIRLDGRNPYAPL